LDFPDHCGRVASSAEAAYSAEAACEGWIAKADDPGRVDELSRDNAKPTSGVKEAVRRRNHVGRVRCYELLRKSDVAVKAWYFAQGKRA